MIVIFLHTVLRKRDEGSILFLGGVVGWSWFASGWMVSFHRGTDDKTCRVILFRGTGILVVVAPFSLLFHHHHRLVIGEFLCFLFKIKSKTGQRLL